MFGDYGKSRITEDGSRFRVLGRAGLGDFVLRLHGNTDYIIIRYYPRFTITCTIDVPSPKIFQVAAWTPNVVPKRLTHLDSLTRFCNNGCSNSNQNENTFTSYSNVLTIRTVPNN